MSYVLTNEQMAALNKLIMLGENLDTVNSDTQMDQFYSSVDVAIEVILKMMYVRKLKNRNYANDPTSSSPNTWNNLDEAIMSYKEDVKVECLEFLVTSDELIILNHLVIESQCLQGSNSVSTMSRFYTIVDMAKKVISGLVYGKQLQDRGKSLESSTKTPGTGYRL